MQHPGKKRSGFAKILVSVRGMANAVHSFQTNSACRSLFVTGRQHANCVPDLEHTRQLPESIVSLLSKASATVHGIKFLWRDNSALPYRRYETLSRLRLCPAKTTLR